MKGNKYKIGFIISLILFILSYISVSLPVCVVFLLTGELGDNLSGYIGMLGIFLSGPFLVIFGESMGSLFSILYLAELCILLFLIVFFLRKYKKNKSMGVVENED